MSFRRNERNAKTTKDQRCVEENLWQSEEGALARIGNFVWVSGSGQGKVCGSCEKFIEKEVGAER